MDAITTLSIVSSIATLICFVLEIYSIMSKNAAKKNNPNINPATYSGSSTVFNINSNNTNNFNSHNNSSYTIKDIYNPPAKSKTTSKFDSTDFVAFFILFLFLGGILNKFYLNNKSSIILDVIIWGIFCFSITLTCLLVIAKKQLISNFTLCLKTLKWFPIFIGINFVYHPFYKSDNLDNVEQLLKNGNNYISIFFTHNYSSDFIFILLQFLGLVMIAAVFSFYLLISIKDLYKAFKTNLAVKDSSLVNVIPYLIFLVYIFSLVSGLYIKLFNL